MDATEGKITYFHIIFNSIKFEYFPTKGVFANIYKLRGQNRNFIKIRIKLVFLRLGQYGIVMTKCSRNG